MATKLGFSTGKGFIKVYLDKDENGVLRYGDIIIPQKKLVYSNKTEIPTNDSVPCVIPGLDSYGKKYQIDFDCGSFVYVVKESKWIAYIAEFSMASEVLYNSIIMRGIPSEGAIRFMRNCSSDYSNSTIYVERIYEIIE